jgi:hypothetical protein
MDGELNLSPNSQSTIINGRKKFKHGLGCYMGQRHDAGKKSILSLPISYVLEITLALPTSTVDLGIRGNRKSLE